MEPDFNPWLWIIATAVVSGLLCTGITAIYWSRRLNGLYTRGWNAGKEFAARELHNTILR